MLVKTSEKTEMDFKTIDTFFALAMLIIGFLFLNLIRFYKLGAGVTIFAIVVFAVTFGYLQKSKYKQSTQSIICIVLAGLSAAQFSLFDNELLKILNLAFLAAIFIYWVCLVTGNGLDSKLSIYLLGDFFNQTICIPFENFLCCLFGVQRITKLRNLRGVFLALLGIIIFFPIILLVIGLLMSADMAFEDFVIKGLELIKIEKLIEYATEFVVGIPFAFYLYALVYGNVKKRNTSHITSKSVDRTLSLIKIAPKISIYSALTTFNIIYFAFFVVQATYLFSAFGGNLPNTFTYAEYARRGFFELCIVAGINLGVLAVSYFILKREPNEEPKIFRIETVLVSLFTILLIVTALSKMIMYIEAYGLTQLRVYTSWFMILLLFIFAVVCIRQFKKFNAIRIIIIGFVSLFVILTYSDIDGRIAEYNISRYKNGTLANLDIDMLDELSDAAIPYMYDLYLNTDKNDTATRQKLLTAIKSTNTYDDNSFRIFNLQKHEADRIRIMITSESMQVIE